MEKSNEIDRLEEMPSVYAKMNVCEILDRIEAIATGIMEEPSPDNIDTLLGDAEEVMDLVATVRAHLGIPVPDYFAESNLRKDA